MLGLFYPAVLGTIAYAVLSAVVGPLLPWAMHRAFPSLQSLDKTSLIRALLYVITFTFYCCDYFYLRFTNVYRLLFFFFDCFIIIGLYLTAQVIEVSGANGANTIPDLRLIVYLYCFFMLLYLWWDLLERNSASPSADDRKLYKFVISWEALSLVTLLIAACLLRQTMRSSIVLCSVLAIITLTFICVDVRKKRLFRDLPPHECSTAD